jgi:hypothetical protein
MKNPFKVTFVLMSSPVATPLVQQAIDYFYNWSAEGGLTEAINSSMRQDIGAEIQLTDSTSDSMEFTVYAAPSKKALKH